MVGVTKLAAVFGTKVKTCLMTHLQSLMRMQPIPSGISPRSPGAHPLTLSSCIAMLISMKSPNSLESLGNPPKPSPFHLWSPIWASNGTSQNALWLFLSIRKPSTKLPSKNGFPVGLTTWMKPRSFTASFSMHAWCFLQGTRTSPVWKASWPPLAPTPPHLLPYSLRPLLVV